MDGSCSIPGQLKIHIICKSEDLNKKDCLGNINADITIIIKGMFQKYRVILG
jgi:hypothetical protein